MERRWGWGGTPPLLHPPAPGRRGLARCCRMLQPPISICGPGEYLRTSQLPAYVPHPRLQAHRGTLGRAAGKQASKCQSSSKFRTITIGELHEINFCVTYDAGGRSGGTSAGHVFLGG